MLGILTIQGTFIYLHWARASPPPRRIRFLPDFCLTCIYVCLLRLLACPASAGYAIKIKDSHLHRDRGASETHVMKS